MMCATPDRRVFCPRAGVKAWITLVGILTGAWLHAQVELDGNIKSFVTGWEPPSVQGLSESLQARDQGIAFSRIRLRLRFEVNANTSLLVAYEAAPTVRFPEAEWVSASVVPSPDIMAYRVGDLHSTLVPASGDVEGSFSVTQNLDRLALHFSLDAVDITLGRQPIAFGSARVINPTDTLAPFTYQALDKEETSGQDAVRLTFPLGAMSELDAAVVLGDQAEARKSAAFLRWKTFVANNDLSFLAQAFRRHLLLGVDWTRSIKGAGFWLEAAHVWDRQLAGHAPDSDDYLRVSTGLDYALTDNSYAYIEYHFSSAGFNRPEDFDRSQDSCAFRDGGVYLLGRHYLAPGLTCTVTPLLTVGATALAQLDDGSALIAPSLEYSFSTDVFLQAGAFLGLGDEPTWSAGQWDVLPQSEFGLYGNLIYTSVRLYF